MILLDTNVISEPLRPSKNPLVIEWLNAQHIETLYLSAITLAELRYGIALLPEGRKRQSISEDLERNMLPLFAGRILSFDESVCDAFALIQAGARRQGKILGWADAAIAAIAQANNMTVASRDIDPFLIAQVPVINPWEEN